VCNITFYEASKNMQLWQYSKFSFNQLLFRGKRNFLFLFIISVLDNDELPNNFIFVCAAQLLIFVLQVMSSQAMKTVLQKNEEGDHGEESTFIILGRCQKNSEKIKKIIKQ
jgi:hypothetical protein